MKIAMAVFLMLLFVFLCYGIWQYFELKKFRVKSYVITSEKISQEIRIAVLADLHGYEYGINNQKLVQSVRDCRPQMILIPGDMIVSKYPETYDKALHLLAELTKIAPVYYSYGNHESRVAKKGLLVSDDFAAYVKKVQEIGVHFLNNQSTVVPIMQDNCVVTGLELGLEYYQKGKQIPLEKGCITKQLGASDDAMFQILLAHNPLYSEDYAAWGADLTFCGHNHGGLICIPGIGSLISPQLTWLPRYNAGKYQINGGEVIVSRGLGTHTFHIRIFNRAELLCVKILPK